MSDNLNPDIGFDFHGPALDEIFDTYRDLRGKCPVGRSEKYGGFWYVMKSDDIFAAEQDPETFAVAPSMLLPAFGTDVPLIPIDIDPPDHTDYRRILLPLFTPKAIAKLSEGMHRTARELAEEVARKDIVDASTLFARPMPTIVFSRLAGFPEKDWPKFDQWVDDIIYERTVDPERAWQAGRDVMAYFDALLASRDSVQHTDDLIAELTAAELKGRKLTHEELLSYCFLLFLAGLDTTAWAIRSSLWFLAQHPEEQQKLRDDPDLIPLACEEFLRTLSPVQGMARTCLKDVEVSGQKIPAGDRVLLVFGAGNRDPAVYDNPDEIVLDRENNRHLAFGGGIHRCLGSNLGRQELIVALEEFLVAVPAFSLADPDEKWHGVGPLTLKIGE
ncbi:cytochrome P450 [Streptomyces sp. SID8361]|uniref:cytochrome P450 n=1 Tax=Streptomyces sp. MnatMP-M27 TaxID=1839768 RepID=UPI00081F5E74|nr:cytochrome P450 [Streptomyces sp. MnatMP-M27]MYU11091.1 cytochrome P450 [Streptomyces sp. SID8361]SCF78198.1 Cytochrome P450 [Streptomyces sp. MnatMP-M27]